MSINVKRKVWGVFLAVFTAIAMIYAADEGTKQPPVAEHDSLAQFTIEQLAKFNGKNGNPAYVAVDSVVYDVTKVKAWKNGEHKRGLKAGNDLSQQILKSPHGKKVLKNLPVVGRLVPTIKADSASAVTPKKEPKLQEAPGEK